MFALFAAKNVQQLFICTYIHRLSQLYKMQKNKWDFIDFILKYTESI